MKRLVLVAVLLVFGLSAAFSQIAYKKGDQVASAMLGLGFTGIYSGATSTIPPIQASYDFYALDENISLGAFVGYSSSKYENNYGGYGYKWTWSYLMFGGRGLYHYDLLHNDKIDTYGGVLLGYDVASSSSEYTGNWGFLSQPSPATSGGIMFGGFVGGRYFFSPNLAAQAEIGYGIGYFNIGLAYKL